MNRYKIIAAAAFTLILLAACGSYGNRDPYGYPSYPSTGNYGSYDIRGTVDSVDPNNQSIFLTNVSGYGDSLNTGRTSSVRVYYDSRTQLSYQGRSYRPDQLEPGDEVTVQVNRSGNQLIAQSMDVTYNSRNGMASGTSAPPPPDTYGTYGGPVLHGTIRSIDTERRTILVDHGDRAYTTVEYSSRTPVSFNGRAYSVNDLEPGDEIDVRTTDLGGGRTAVQDIIVTRTTNGMGSNGTYGNYGSSSSSNSFSTMRGTVRSVDATNRTIELENTNWVSGFRTNTGSRFFVHYDPNVSVDVNGQMYPVTNLERGDVVEVQFENLGSSNYIARSVVLVRNVRQ
jgi:hypothetical protein